MSAEIIQFIPKKNPKLVEAIDFARKLSGKCAEPDCTMDENGCSGIGCLLNNQPASRDEMKSSFQDGARRD